MKQEQFAAVEKKTLEVETKITKRASFFLENSKNLSCQNWTCSCQNQNRQNYKLDFNAKHPILIHWKHYVVVLFVTSTRAIRTKEQTEHVRNIIQQHFCIIGVRNSLRSKFIKFFTCQKDRAQTKAPVMAELPTENLDSSTVFANVGNYRFNSFREKIGRRIEKRRCCLFVCSHV